jgi:GNAT superfamily N-acetyltransferase
MIFRIREVAARRDRLLQEQICRFNSMAPDTFPALQDRHFERGHWWLAYPLGQSEPVAFAGMVPFEPFPLVGYLKRAFVLPAARGHRLQLRLLEEREAKARQLGWTLLVSECGPDNRASAANFAKAAFQTFEPEQRWGAPNSLYWKKDLAA